MIKAAGFVDHFENDEAVIAKTDRTVARIPRQVLPRQVRQGDFIVENSETHCYSIDYATTELRLREIRRMADSFFD